MRAGKSQVPLKVGDILPDSGIIYYALPLSYGFPFYRCAAIGGQIVIVDRASGAVIQVLEQAQ